jgi:hypothetical protein
MKFRTDRFYHYANLCWRKWRRFGLWHNLSAAGGNRGFRTISEQPFAEKGMLAIRSVVKVTLAGDHRATDGLIGSHF